MHVEKLMAPNEVIKLSRCPSLLRGEGGDICGPRWGEKVARSTRGIQTCSLVEQHLQTTPDPKPGPPGEFFYHIRFLGSC